MTQAQARPPTTLATWAKGRFSWVLHRVKSFGARAINGAPQGILTAVVVGSAAAVTAFATMLLEGWLPGEGSARQPMVSSRLYGLVISLLVLWAGFVGRRHVVRHRGTLYYVRLLDSWMEDLHRKPLKDTMGGYQDTRVLHRHISSQVDDGVLDVTEEVSGLGRDLQRSMNDDSVESGFQIAPNLLWPAAMALAFDWQTWEPSTLEEFTGGGRLLSWPVPSVASPPRWSGAQPRPVWIEKGKAEGEDTKSAARSIWIQTFLTGERSMSKHHFPVAAELRIGVLSRDAGPRHDVAETLDTMDDASFGASVHSLNCVVPRRWRAEPSTTGLAEHTAVAHPYDAARVLTQTIRRVLHEHPEAPLLLSVRAMKTVNFAVGVWLARETPVCRTRLRDRCEQASCLYPWSRIIPILERQARIDARTGCPAPASLIARVHPGQPPADVLRRRAATGRLE